VPCHPPDGCHRAAVTVRRQASWRRDSSSARGRDPRLTHGAFDVAVVGVRFALAAGASHNLSLHKQVVVTPRVAYAIPLSLVCFTLPAAATDAVQVAASLIGKPYIWGAEGPGAFDCSGLTQYAYREIGIELPRRAISQSRAGDAAGRRLERGDLVFFSTDERRSLVTHVGIYEGGGIMINASKRHGRVRRDSLSEDYWADRFMFARRISDEDAGPDAPVAEERSRLPRGDRRRTAVRVLERVADVLLRRAGR